MNQFFLKTLAPMLIVSAVSPILSSLFRGYMVGKDTTLQNDAGHTIVVFKDLPGQIILPSDHKLTFNGGSGAAAIWTVEKR